MTNRLDFFKIKWLIGRLKYEAYWSESRYNRYFSEVYYESIAYRYYGRILEYLRRPNNSTFKSMSLRQLEEYINCFPVNTRETAFQSVRRLRKFGLLEFSGKILNRNTHIFLTEKGISFIDKFYPLLTKSSPPIERSHDVELKAAKIMDLQDHSAFDNRWSGHAYKQALDMEKLAKHAEESRKASARIDAILEMIGILQDFGIGFDDWIIRKKAADKLGILKATAALPDLKKALNDKVGDVREAVKQAISIIETTKP